MARLQGISKFKITADIIDGKFFKNVQYGIFTFTSGQKVKLITVNEVDVSKTVVVISTRYDSGSEPVRNLACTGTMSDSTTLRVERIGDDVACYVAYQIIEFENIKSFQTGEVSSEGSVGISISRVDTSKSLFFVSRRTTNAQTDARNFASRVFFSNSTLLSINNYSGYNWYTRWYVVEFM